MNNNNEILKNVLGSSTSALGAKWPPRLWHGKLACHLLGDVACHLLGDVACHLLGDVACHAVRVAPQRSSAADGVALILVLGVLSLMLLLAVSFAISMRTERLAADNYADSVRARHLAQVGLVRALDDICRIMGTNLNNPAGQVYPLWAVTNSYSTNWTKLNTNTLLRLYTNASDSATNFIPRALWQEAVNANNLEPSNHWVEIWSSNAVGTNNHMNLIGRVGYLILNCSGLLDANYAGGVGSTRQCGTNPNEIALAIMDEIGPGANNLVNNRDLNAPPDIRYESLEELNEYSVSSSPSNFITYSYFPNGYWSGTTSFPPVNLTGLMAPARKTPIINAFTNAGFSAAEAGILYSNLIDYVDANSDTVFNGGVEPVPMINEIAVTNQVIDMGGGNFQSQGGVAIEWWHPFVGTGGAYQIQTSVMFVGIGGFGGLVPVPAIINDLKPISPTGPALAMIPSIPFSSGLSAGNTVQFRSTISVQVLKGGITVDNVSVVLTNNSSTTADRIGVEFIDPRFNGDMTYAKCTNAPSLGATNACTMSWWTTNQGWDTDSAMYVANTNLRTVGELGYLAYAPWKTVKLYGPNLRKVLDVFAIGTNAADSYVTHARRGLVNPNSLEPEALPAVFADMPVDEYPGGPSIRLSTITLAREIADRVYDSFLQYTNTFTNLSDFGRALTNFAALGGGAIALDNELKRESLFRNACDLMSPRQNLFTIIIDAQVASGGSIPRNTARQRAVAIVWRDPYTGEFFVRSFQWLED
ncbi:MAG: hypothetical protein KJ919_03755 [Verrucomicrobia bacterium]|nr:hypothetical protein [Verrucomicrobiota bacterium]MBU4291956.1 hypothetical protein [Verrucomicrobiota bacterium]